MSIKNEVLRFVSAALNVTACVTCVWIAASNHNPSMAAVFAAGATFQVVYTARYWRAMRQAGRDLRALDARWEKGAK